MKTSRTPRVALFTDSYAEANGVARLSRALESSAERHGRPLLCVHGGQSMRVTAGESIQRLELPRSAASFRLEHDLTFDPFLWRHYGRVREVVTAFQPDVLHVTGPSDVGQLGALLGHRLNIPIVGSWHTNLHQYAAMRSMKWCRWLPPPLLRRVLPAIERHALTAALHFYRIPRVLLAPNDELVALLAGRTGKATHLMKHGVDCATFAPGPPRADGAPLRIGFVGRLSAEKRVRLIATLQGVLRANGLACEFVFIGEGTERRWLQREMPDAQFPGVLHGDALARAYAGLDVFVFPSPSETFGLAVLEAMASGVAVLAMAQGGPGFVIEHGVSGWLAGDEQAFLAAGLALARDAGLRARLGRAARVRALTWSWDAVSDELYDVYSEALLAAS